MGGEKLLLIDDSRELLENLSEYLTSKGYDITTASDGTQGISKIASESYDIILTDLKMPNADGFEVLQYVKGNSPETICIILTGYGTIKNAVEAIKKGAFDYLTKPVQLA